MLWYPFAPWPATPDGAGFSLVPVDPNADYDTDDASDFRSSTYQGGSPGEDDPGAPSYTVVINEALTHTDPAPPYDTI